MTLDQIVTAALPAAGVTYLLTQMYAQKRRAIKESDDELAVETERLICLLKDQRDSLGDKVDALTLRVDKLAEVIVEYACPQATDCATRKALPANHLQEILMS